MLRKTKPPSLIASSQLKDGGVVCADAVPKKAGGSLKGRCSFLLVVPSGACGGGTCFRNPGKHLTLAIQFPYNKNPYQNI